MEYKFLNENDQKCRKDISKNEDCAIDDEANDDIDFFLLNSVKTDSDTWKILNQYFDEIDPRFDYRINGQLIDNSIQAFSASDTSTQNNILLFIYNILQHSGYVKDLFENYQIHLLICSLIANSGSDSLKIQAFNILDTYLFSLKDEDVVIRWANELLKCINPLILNSIQGKDTILSTLLNISSILIEKGDYSVDDMHQILDFYISIIGNLKYIDVYYGFHNLEIILDRFPCFYVKLLNCHQATINLIYSALSKKENPLIAKTSLNILTPVISHDLSFFLNNDFVKKCSDLLQENNDKDLALSITKSLIKICTISHDACIQVIDVGFLKCNDIFRYGFTVEVNIIEIIKQIVQKINICCDKFTNDFISRLLISFIRCDDIYCIITVLDIVIALLNTKFNFDKDLIENISQLAFQRDDDYDNPELMNKSQFIISQLNKRNPQNK